MATEQAPTSSQRADVKSVLLIVLVLAAVVLSSVNLAVSLSAAKPPQENSQIIQENIEPADSHDLTYTLTTPNGLTWIVRPAESAEVRNSQYELVRIDTEGKTAVMESFEFIPGLGDISLGVTTADILEFKYSMSPGEAFLDITEIFFNADGNESFRAAYNTSSDTVNFKNSESFRGSDTLEYTASLAISGACPNETTIQDGVTFVPGTVELLGVKVTSSAGQQMFNLNQPQTVDCGVAYGENIVNPMIDAVNILNGALSFSLPTGGYVRATYDTDGLEVKFIK